MADDDIENYPVAQINLPITVGVGDNGCALEGDLNTDSFLNVLDIVQISNFILGISTPTYECAADINGDGSVDVGDLLEVVGSWGPCE